MTRLALTLALLSFCTLASAQMVTPSHASGDGSSPGCPDSSNLTAAAPEGRPDDVALPPAAATITPPAKLAPAASHPGVRPKAPMRWHSFLPGMMK